MNIRADRRIPPKLSSPHLAMHIRGYLSSGYKYLAVLYAELVVIERFCAIVILQATNSDESVLIGE